MNSKEQAGNSGDLENNISESIEVARETDQPVRGGEELIFLGKLLGVGSIIGHIFNLSGWLEFSQSIVSKLVFECVFAFLVICSVYIIHLGRKYKAKTISADEIINSSSKKPIFLIRPFDEDTEPDFDFSMVFSGPITNYSTIEFQFKMAVSKLGPMIAIGNPNEQLPTLGATRSYFKHETWLENAKKYIDKSQLIIIILGISDGVCREIEEVLKMDDLSKVVIYLPIRSEDFNNKNWDISDRQSVIKSFWSLCLGLINADIKEIIQHKLNEKDVGQYLYFENKREPVFYIPPQNFYKKANSVYKEFKPLLKIIKL